MTPIATKRFGTLASRSPDRRVSRHSASPHLLALGACFGSFVFAMTGAGCKQGKTEWNSNNASGAQPPSAISLGKEADTPLATMDGVVITLGEFQDRLNRQSPYIRARYTSLEQKKEFLDNLIRFEILAKEAARRNYDQDPEVIRTMKQVMIQKLVTDEFDQKLTAAAISDDEIKAYYEKNIAEYVQPEEVRVSAIVLKNKAQALRILPEAQGEPGKTNKGFRDLVGMYSADEEGKLRGGDLRYFAVDTTEVPKPVVAASFALVQVGDVSGIVEGGDGNFYILKKTGHKKSMTKSLEDAKGMIRNKLFRDKRVTMQDQFLNELRAKANVVVNEANLAKVRIDMSNKLPDDGHGHMGTPGQHDEPGAGSGSAGSGAR